VTSSLAQAGGRSADAAGRGRTGTVRLLLLEDDPADAELTQRQLARAGLRFTATVVDTRAAFVQSLGDFRPDVILADFSLPGFSGDQALALARQACPQVPFIVLSGAIGDEAAVELIRHGATDYVLKDRPARLPAVIQRALDGARQQAELARVEAQLHRSQRLVSIGRLAGGIAHEFNNQIGVVVNCAAFIRDEAERREGSGDDSEAWRGVRHDAEQIERSGERMALFVRQLLAAGAQQMSRSQPVNLGDVVHGLEETLRRTLGDRVELRLETAPRIWLVNADQGQMQQVLLILATNAREAMPDGGVFSVAISNVAADDTGPGARRGRFPRGCVRLSVSDTGAGMEPETLEHAFEPFFTTEPFVEGRGLGLATLYGIISQAGGTVDMASAPGAGTTVTALLPRADRPPAQDAAGDPLAAG